MDPGSRKENASKKEFPAAEITEDGFLGGQLRLRQPKGGHRAGHDAILLAAATPARSGDRVVDLGAVKRLEPVAGGVAERDQAPHPPAIGERLRL